MNFIKKLFRKKEIPSLQTGIAAVRREYLGSELNEQNVGNNPVELFGEWYTEASKKVRFDVNAMTLSTIDGDRPTSRIVLLKGFDENGFIFYTNYDSDKGKQIEANNSVSLNFYWAESFRQIRIEGFAEKISPEVSDDYFNSRPLESQFSAIASPQSKQVNNRAELEAMLENVRNYWKKTKPKRPDNWGGYIVIPNRIEFWQGRTGRLHDRIVFTKSDDEWNKMRLAP